MQVLGEMLEQGHEQVIFCNEPSSGLKAIIAIHNTTLGPALGGVRIWPYESEEEALFDALRLAKGMTYKNAAMGLDLGGGKAVIIADPKKEKSDTLLKAFGKHVDSLGGRYITAADVGTVVEDMDIIRSETPYVGGMPQTSGDPALVTAYGVFRGMEAAVLYSSGSSDLSGKRVGIQGAGKVGIVLCKYLLDAGAKVIITDIFPDKLEKAQELGAETIDPDQYYDLECDILAPCALGGVINSDTIPKIKAKIICGAANNQLLEVKHGEELSARGILYAPDFIVNGGGVVNVAQEFAPGGYNRENAMARASKIYEILLEVFDLADKENIVPGQAANNLAEKRIHLALQQKRLYIP